MMRTAISNTLLLSMNLNPELVEEYMRLAGEVEFAQNRNRKTAAWVTKAGLECSFCVGREYNGIAKMFSDTVGASANYRSVNYSGNVNESFIPYQSMINELSELTGKQAYKYRAFELLVTLDLEAYKAVRRIIVPADIEFARLHKVLQSVFDWHNYHLYDFTIFGGNKRIPVARIVPFEDDLGFDEDAILMEGHTTSICSIPMIWGITGNMKSSLCVCSTITTRNHPTCWKPVVKHHLRMWAAWEDL